MKTKALFLFLAALVALPVLQAQQSPQPQTPPCTNPAPAPARKPGWLEQKARALACQKNSQFCNLPTSTADATGLPAAKPCPQGTTPKPQTASPAPAVAPQVVTPKTPSYACPPHTTLIPGTAYCLAGDHTTVDAIALPADMAASAFPTKPTPAKQ